MFVQLIFLCTYGDVWSDHCRRCWRKSQ